MTIGARIPTLATKLGLALLSVLGYWLIVQVAQALEASEALPDPGRWFHILVGLVFGVLVMAPYATGTAWGWRVAGLSVASAIIYFLAVRFVAYAPAGFDAMTTFVLAGGGAALVVGFAIVVLAPRGFVWKLVPLMLVAGAAGGAVFELAKDAVMLAGHAAWQLLVCLALHWSFRRTST